MDEYGIAVYNKLPQVDFGAAVLAVAHKEFESLNVRELIKGIIYYVKGVMPKEQVDARLELNHIIKQNTLNHLHKI